jgi:hypothetical protein
MAVKMTDKIDEIQSVLYITITNATSEETILECD